MSTPGAGSIFGSPIIYGQVDFGPTFGRVYRPVTQKRIVTVAGVDTIQPYDQIVVYRKTVPEIFSVQLPQCALWMRYPYGGFDIILKDGASNSSAFPITAFAWNGEFIDGVLNGTFTLQGDGASVIFSPLADGSGWVTL